MLCIIMLCIGNKVLYIRYQSSLLDFTIRQVKFYGVKLKDGEVLRCDVKLATLNSTLNNPFMNMKTPVMDVAFSECNGLLWPYLSTFMEKMWAEDVRFQHCNFLTYLAPS